MASGAGFPKSGGSLRVNGTKMAGEDGEGGGHLAAQVSVRGVGWGQSRSEERRCRSVLDTPVKAGQPSSQRRTAQRGSTNFGRCFNGERFYHLRAD